MKFKNWFIGLTVWVGVGLMGLPTVEAHEEESLRVAVVGDTGIGERSDRRGFKALQKSLVAQKADALLHLGDFIYQPKLFPSKCSDRHIQTIKKTLVDPHPIRIFVAGDNDLPPHKWKPKASGCWDRIAALATPFDTPSGEIPVPKALEGTMQIGPVLFAVLNMYDWKDPTPWLEPLVRKARKQHRWVIFALHEPPITTAWYEDRRDILEQISRLQPDLVFSGNQHSYERFFPVRVAGPDGRVSHTAESKYSQGTGTTFVVTGGGGAFLRPFADLQGKADRSAPPDIKNALAKRSIMLHFLTLEIDAHTIRGQTHRVCPPPKMRANSRWRPAHPMWRNIPLECDGQPVGTKVVDRFEITQK